MGFILSKINLMILVIAIFAIISYFMLGMGNLLVNRVALDLVLNNSREIYGMVFSQTSCDAKEFLLPESLATSVGSGAGGTYYKFFIKKIPGASGEMDSVSFFITPAKSPNKVLAADNFRLDAEIYFCDFQTQDMVSELDCSLDEIQLEPQAAPAPKDAFVVVKQVRSGIKSVYFIACSTDDSVCKANFTSAAEKLVLERFDCSPTSEFEEVAS